MGSIFKDTHYLYFFDLNEILLDRYPASIAKSINEITKQKLEFIFFYSEIYNGDKPTPNKLPPNSIVVFERLFSREILEGYIRKYPPAAFVTIGLRIPDIFLLGYFNRIGVKTYMVQHGIFTNHLRRIPMYKLLREKASKFNQYLKYSYEISIISNTNFIPLVKDLYRFYFQGKRNFPDLETIKNSNLISQTAFIFDRSWVNYYQSKYGYSNQSFKYIGNPDYQLVTNFTRLPIENSVCYICQSLVEDGRYLKKDYIEFLKSLKETFRNKKLYLKLHPRSKLELYKPFESENFILTEEFKNCHTYIGHYSSLVELSYQLGRNVILWNLKDHDIPENFRQYASIISNDWKEVLSFLRKIKKDSFQAQAEIENYLREGLTPIEKISQIIVEDLK